MPTFYHHCHVYGNGDAVGKVIFIAVIIALVLKANFTMMNSKSITRRYNSSDREAIVCVCVCRHHFINNYSFGVAWWIDRFDDEWIRYCCFSLKFIDWWPKDTHWLYLCYVYLFKLLDQFDRRRAAIVLHLSYLTFLDGKYGNQCQNGRFNWTLKSSMRSISFDKIVHSA